MLAPADTAASTPMPIAALPIVDVIAFPAALAAMPPANAVGSTTPLATFSAIAPTPPKTSP